MCQPGRSEVLLELVRHRGGVPHHQPGHQPSLRGRQPVHGRAQPVAQVARRPLHHRWAADQPWRRVHRQHRRHRLAGPGGSQPTRRGQLLARQQAGPSSVGREHEDGGAHAHALAASRDVHDPHPYDEEILAASGSAGCGDDPLRVGGHHHLCCHDRGVRRPLVDRAGVQRHDPESRDRGTGGQAEQRACRREPTAPPGPRGDQQAGDAATQQPGPRSRTRAGRDERSGPRRDRGHRKAKVDRRPCRLGRNRHVRPAPAA